MVRNTTILTGASLVIATLLLAAFAGTATAQTDVLTGYEGQAGLEAVGEATGGYYVDATEGYEAAQAHNDELHEQASASAHQADEAYAQAKGDAWEQVNATETPEPPECDCGDVIAQAEQAGNAQLSHADRIAQEAEVDTPVADAGADLSAAAKAKAWASNLFDGLAQAYTSVADLLDSDLGVEDEARATAEQALDADDELRGEALAVIDEERPLPEAQPRVDGQASVQHASQVATGAAGSAEGHLP